MRRLPGPASEWRPKPFAGIIDGHTPHFMARLHVRLVYARQHGARLAEDAQLAGCDYEPSCLRLQPLVAIRLHDSEDKVSYIGVCKTRRMRRRLHILLVEAYNEDLVSVLREE